MEEVVATGPTLLGVDVIWAATILAGIASAALLYAFYTAFTVRDPMVKRVKALNERREQLKAGIVVSASRKRAKLVKKNEHADKLRGRLDSMKVMQDSQIKEIHQKLAHAGIRNKDVAVFIILARIILPLVIGGGLALALYYFNVFPEWGALKKLGLFAIGGFLSYRGADMFIDSKAKSRTNAIRKGLPDAIDLLVICAEAGLTIDAAFARVAKELGRGYPELAEEFTLTSIELGFLTERRQAFENMAYRVNLESLRGLVSMMIQTEKYGTPLASALRVLSAEYRNDRMMRAEEKAARLPAIMTIPLIMFILPVLFVVILGPAACDISDKLMGPNGMGGG